jgi:2-C-methyl-D-erythritol 4-phosphate cytidylyltransferase
MIAWSIDVFASMPEIAELVIVTEPEFIERMEAIAHPRVRHATLRVVRGGADRQASVRAGIAALSPTVAGILVHDGARPLVQSDDVRAGMRPVRPGIATLLAAPVVDTIKVAAEDGTVRRTLDRETLWAAQTPQFATARDLRAVHQEAARRGAPPATDDAALLERAGLDVLVVPGAPENFKVTVPSDLVRAEALLRERAPSGAADEEVLVVECYVDPRAVDAVLADLEARDARIDEIDRELPQASVIRAYATNAALRGFGLRLHELAGEDAVFTAHLSHLAPRATPLDRRHE